MVATGLLVASVVRSSVLLCRSTRGSPSGHTATSPRTGGSGSAGYDRFHHIRVGVIVGAFVLFTVALV
ncbi:hypothetical protein [Streptomyces sp. NPDC005322]|uniref:hypothetical protein n=1 Tax=Streptomyces sp. NPDC005322 TaxID=3157032 RepID=UPI0033A144B1